MAQYRYTDFRMENNGITFGDGVMDEGVLISIPFVDDTPKSVKDRLDGMIRWNMGVWLRENGADGYILKPEDLLLDARMQIGYYGSSESSPFYCIAMVISGLYMEAGCLHEVWIDDAYNIQAETPECRMEFMKYCQDKLDKVLFPVGKY